MRVPPSVAGNRRDSCLSSQRTRKWTCSPAPSSATICPRLAGFPGNPLTSTASPTHAAAVVTVSLTISPPGGSRCRVALFEHPTSCGASGMIALFACRELRKCVLRIPVAVFVRPRASGAGGVQSAVTERLTESRAGDGPGGRCRGRRQRGGEVSRLRGRTEPARCRSGGVQPARLGRRETQCLRVFRASRPLSGVRPVCARIADDMRRLRQSCQFPAAASMPARAQQ